MDSERIKLEKYAKNFDCNAMENKALIRIIREKQDVGACAFFFNCEEERLKCILDNAHSDGFKLI